MCSSGSGSKPFFLGFAVIPVGTPKDTPSLVSSRHLDGVVDAETDQGGMAGPGWSFPRRSLLWVFLQVLFERATITHGFLATVVLAQIHDEGMKFIKEVCVARQMHHEPALHIIVGCMVTVKPVITQKSFCIGIDHEDGPVEGVKENAVGCLRSDTIDAEENLAERFSG